MHPLQRGYWQHFRANAVHRCRHIEICHNSSRHHWRLSSISLPFYITSKSLTHTPRLHMHAAAFVIIVKLICEVSACPKTEIVLCLQVPTIGLVMGSKGVISRILSPKYGGYLTFGALNKGQESAPGQPTVQELAQVYRYVSLLCHQGYFLCSNVSSHGEWVWLVLGLKDSISNDFIIVVICYLGTLRMQYVSEQG